MEVTCEVLAASLMPTKASQRIKTDRRDADQLARGHRAGSRGRREGPTQGAASLGQIPAAAWAHAGRREGFDQAVTGLEVTLLNYVRQGEHVEQRIVHGETAMDDAVLEALRALRG